MNLTVTKLDSVGYSATKVHGLTLPMLGDPEVRKYLQDLFDDVGLVIFADTPKTAEFQLKLAGVFGDLQPFGNKERWVEGYPELMWFIMDPAVEAVYNVNGVDIVGWSAWHTDGMYSASSLRASLLRAVTLPKQGGDTGFLCKIEAYNRLPDDLKRRIENLEVVYRAYGGPHPYGMSGEHAIKVKASANHKSTVAKLTAQFPAAAHPLVVTHKESGRTLLNFAPVNSLYVLGLSPEESDGLLTELSDIVRDERYAYRHRWNDADILLWDNWRFNHKAYGCPAGEDRLMHRVTILGNRTVGRVLDADAIDIGRITELQLRGKREYSRTSEDLAETGLDHFGSKMAGHP